MRRRHKNNMLAKAVTHLRIASCLDASAVSHHLAKNEISDQMNFLRGSSASFTTMLFKICCVCSMKYLSKVLIQPNNRGRSRDLKHLVWAEANQGQRS